MQDANPQKPRPVPLGYQQDPIRLSVKALGAKWTLLVLRDIGFLRLHRFGEIKRNNPGLTARVLSRRLRNMTEEGLVRKVVHDDMTQYFLTSQGEDAVFILLAFLRYGLKHHARHSSEEQKRATLNEMVRALGTRGFQSRSSQHRRLMDE